MVWLNPAALIGLVGLAAPILVHFLRRQRAARVAFPSLRFVRHSRTAAVRLRLPSDLLLLLVRMSIVAAAVVALARPLVVTRSRVAAWNDRVVRALVVDLSESMRGGEVTGQSAATEAGTVAAAESVGGATVVRVPNPDLRSGLRQALTRFASMPPARREIVVISDFQKGALTARDVAMVPPAIGLRFVRVGVSPEERRFRGASVFGADRLVAMELHLTAGSTEVTFAPEGAAVEGLRLLDLEDHAARRLRRIVAAAGAPAPSSAQPMALRFAHAGSAGPAGQLEARAISPGWMLQTVLRLRNDSEVATLAREFDAAPMADERPWTVIVRDRQQRPLVRVAAAGETLVVDVAARPGTLVAAATVQGAMLARAGSMAMPERETQLIPAVDLATWTRDATPVPSDVGGHAEGSDARWFWGAVLGMLFGEAALRRNRRAEQPEVRVDAA